MSLLSRSVAKFVFCTALFISTNVCAGLYGFTEADELPPPEHLNVPPRRILNYRKDMRDLLVSIAHYGKSRTPNFQVLTHEGQYLLDKSLWEYHLKGYNHIRHNSKPVDDFSFLSMDIPEIIDETPAGVYRYKDAIDGVVVNNHYCHSNPVNYLISQEDLALFSIEQCPSEQALDDAIIQSIQDKIAIYPFTDIRTAFQDVYHQLIINENANSVTSLNQAKNISFLISDEAFSSPYQMVDAIRRSNYDVVVIRPVFHNEIPFTPEDVRAMKFKQNGARRLILSLFNISEISETDYLWKKRWYLKRPDWIVAKSLSTQGSYIVKYWTPEWKYLVSRYVKSIVDSDYDGVFITGLENHSYFEQNKPLE